ncbi:MAG: hypothetical protein DPW09_21320 [Anaerolineae bacterium]|nr:hypothetical protein [Anaerolineae bacterium]
MLAEGLMKYRGDCLSLTSHGAKVYNGVIALFYAPAVKLHLLQRPVDLSERMPAQLQRELRRSFEIKLAA